MWKREKRERDEKKKERLNGRGRKMIEERGRMRRAKQNRADQNRVDQIRIEQNRTGQIRIG